MKLEIVEFKTKNVRIECSKHGPQKVTNVYDPFTKKDTAIACVKCVEESSKNET